MSRTEHLDTLIEELRYREEAMNEEQRQIPRRLEELDALVERLADVVEKIEARLASVLLPETSVEDSKSVVDESVPLASQLFTLNTQLLTSVNCLESILSRIEL